MASRIHKRRDSDNLIVSFYNPITKESSQVHFTKNRKEAIEKCRELDNEFYSEHPYLIPSGITICRTSKRFRVYTRYRIFKSCPTLMDAIEVKQNIIADLTEIKYTHTGKNKLFTNE